MLPSRDGGENAIWVGGPGKWSGVFVVFGEISVDGGLEVDERAEDPALEAAACECGEEALDGVEP